MTTIQIRIDAQLKKKAQKVAKDLGMDLSTAIKLFLTQLVLWKRMPFELRTINGFTEKQEKQMKKEGKDWRK